MKLPHLDQVVELARGEAAHVLRAGRLVQGELLARDPAQGQRLLGAEALALAPLSRLLTALHRLATRDLVPRPPARRPGQRARPPRPHRLRLAYDELLALRLFYDRLLATAGQADEHDPPADLVDVASLAEQRARLLPGVLGKFYQRSLNLATHLTLPPALPVRQRSATA